MAEPKGTTGSGVKARSVSESTKQKGQIVAAKAATSMKVCLCPAGCHILQQNILLWCREYIGEGGGPAPLILILEDGR